MKKTAQPGYYPGYFTLSQKDFWDEATRKVVLDRVEKIPPLRFFTEHEAQLMQAILDRVLPQDDRDSEHQIPILNYIDERLFSKRFDGFIYEGMPEEDAAHRLGLKAIEKMARDFHQKSFTELSTHEQESLLLKIRNDDPKASILKWEGVSPNHYWNLLLQDAIAAYYSHPFAWDEIGFGGPAYPRGYMRMTDGLPEPWEKDERRYEWTAPENTLSDAYTVEPDPISTDSHPGQGGTH